MKIDPFELLLLLLLWLTNGRLTASSHPLIAQQKFNIDIGNWEGVGGEQIK